MSDGPVVLEVRDRRAREAWLRFPYGLMRDDRAFIPPLLALERRRISAGNNPFFGFGEAALFLAMREGRPVGRISAQINRASNAHRNVAECHFGFFDCIDDARAAEALIGAAIAWGRARGMTRLVGPFNLSINQECGVLIDGFDLPPALMMPHNLPYYDALLKSSGLEPAVDLHAYRMRVADRTAIELELDRIVRIPGIGIRSLDMTRLHDEVGLVMDIFNDAWSGNWGFVPMTEAELDETARNLAKLLRPQSAVFVTLNGHEAAMMVALPDLNSLIGDFGGRLLPVNFLRLLWRMKTRNPPGARVVLMGVRKRYQRGATAGILLARLVAAIRGAAEAMGLEWIEFSWILETNAPVVRLCEKLAGPPVKRYRIYQCGLAG